MLSRVADNLYWFGRYLQRAENTARLVNVHANLLLDLPRPLSLGWGPLVEIVGADPLYHQHYPAYDEASVVRFLMLDARNPGSILSSLHTAREILRTVRDSAPREVWERLNDLHWFVQEHGERAITRSSRQQFLQRVIDGTMLVYGVLTSNMSRDVGFQFLRIGTNLEQADMTTRILDVRSTSLIEANTRVDLAPFQNIQWMSVLRSLTAYQMYRRHVRQRVTGSHVLRFLLQNREFPRSVTFCLGMIGSTLPHLPQHRSVERTLWRVRAYVADANIDKLLEAGLHQLIDDIQISLNELHEALSQAYFRV
ncbi:MAG TPA: alpha-E domain-containing protein [Nevskiaceae bacterium]|nr:alpha-E domain-containing protein [Nevskiaceae bacterium]